MASREGLIDVLASAFLSHIREPLRLTWLWVFILLRVLWDEEISECLGLLWWAEVLVENSLLLNDSYSWISYLLTTEGRMIDAFLRGGAAEAEKPSWVAAGAPNEPPSPPPDPEASS